MRSGTYAHIEYTPWQPITAALGAQWQDLKVLYAATHKQRCHSNSMRSACVHVTWREIHYCGGAHETAAA
jgi:hypothetical protein